MRPLPPSSDNTWKAANFTVPGVRRCRDLRRLVYPLSFIKAAALTTAEPLRRVEMTSAPSRPFPKKKDARNLLDIL